MAITIDKFVRLLVKSNAVEPKRLKAWLAENGLSDRMQATESTDKFPATKYLAKALIDDGLLTKWQAKFLLSGRHRLMIGSYLLLDRLGREDFGDRFVARHASLDRKVDLQLLASDISSDPQRRQGLIAKTSRVAELDHPSLVHVYDIDQVEDQYFLVVEHVDGQVLNQDAVFDKPELAQLAIDAIEALEYAHQHDVVHGAISTQDIILTDSGIKIQNLTLEILRKAKTDHQPVPEDDFRAISTIGLQLLKSQTANGTGQPNAESLQLELLLTRLRTEGEQVLPELKQWRSEILTQASGKSDPTIESDSVTQQDPDDELSAANETWLSRTWQENPVNLIALGLTLLLLIGGGAAYVIFLAGREPALVESSADGGEQVAQDRDQQQPLDPEEARDPDQIEQQIRSQLPLADGPGGEIEIEDADENETQANNQTPDAPQPDVGESEDAQVETPPGEPAKAIAQLPNDPVADPNDLVADPDISAPAANRGPDDLTEIKGIGKFWDGKLKEHGISTFGQLAAMTPEKLREFTLANHSFGITEANCQSIVNQAKNLSETGIAIAGEPTTETSMGSETDSVDPLAEAKSNPGETKPAEPVLNPAQPFEHFPANVQLPPVAETEEIMVSGLIINPLHKLQATMVSPEGVSRGRLFFELERKDQGEEQRWVVGVKRTERQQVEPIGELRKSPDALFFRWLPTAEGNRFAPNLVNCFIKLATPGGHSTVFSLRKPEKIPALMLDSETLTGELEFRVESLPDPEKIQIEIGQVDDKPEGVELDVSLPNVTAASNGQILLKERDENPTMWVELTADVRNRMRVEAAVMLVVQGRVQPVSARNLTSLLQELDRARLIAEQRLAADTRNDDLKTQRNKIVDQIKLIQQYTKSLEHLSKQPIKLRAIANFEGYQAVLAVSDPALNQIEEQ